MSGENVPYHLRPNKYVERSLFLELLNHVNAACPIAEYLYVGFGGPYLEDFKVLHQDFGIKRMISLEKEAWVYDRQRFNVPYSCVSCRNQTSGQFVADYDKTLKPFGRKRNVLIWLDYAQAGGTREQLNEISALVPRLREFDLLKVTLNANPSSLGSSLADQLKTLQERLRDLLPLGITEAHMAKVVYPKVLLASLEQVIKNGLNGLADLMMQPLANFAYADSSHQMLTFTGIVLKRGKEVDFLETTRIRPPMFSTAWDHFSLIDVPFLSVREKLLIDSAMFNQRRGVEPPTKLLKKLTLAKTPEKTRALVKTYTQFYRFYPHFHRVHY